MGVGRGSGSSRVNDSVQAAVNSPLLETTIEGARAILLNIAGGYDLGMLEVNEAAEQIEQKADRDAIVILGTTIKEELHDEIIVTVIATGFEERQRDEQQPLPAGDSPDADTAPDAGAEPGAETAPEDEDTDNAVHDAKRTGLNNDYEVPSFLRSQQL
jgi:cell division protein FtsZ